MSIELAGEVEKAIGFVKEVLSRGVLMTREELKEFSLIAEQAYVLASQCDLHHALPQVSELRPELDSADPKLGSVQFETKLNLPGDWDDVRDGNYQKCKDEPLGILGPDDDLPELPKKHFVITTGKRWLRDLEMLEKLACQQQQKAPLQSAIPNSLTDNEYTILCALRDKDPHRVLIKDLEEDTDITRKTCGIIAKVLAD